MITITRKIIREKQQNDENGKHEKLFSTDR